MRHVFIVNPAAGKKQRALTIIPAIKEYFTGKENEYTIHVTKKSGDACSYSCNEAIKGDDVRIYSCGGDGTLNEIVNGVFGFNNVEIAAIPLGSGNDFAAYLGYTKQTLLSHIIEGKSNVIDLIKCNGSYSINVCAMGADALVAANVEKFKRIPFVSGSMAYNLAILKCFLGKYGSSLKIIIDDKIYFEGNYLFCVIANGRYYGGGYVAAPFASVNDGKLDIMLAKYISRIKIPSFIKLYRKGNHINLTDIVTYVQCRKIEILSSNSEWLTMDGECTLVNNTVIEIVENAIKVVSPVGSKFL